MISMFAIPNCDTVKKARAFLEKNNIAYDFIDFKKSPPSLEKIQAWCDYFGELPINKKGLTYKKYKEVFESLGMKEKMEFIIANTSMIKRPILESQGKVIAAGFDETQYQKLTTN